VPVAQIGKKGFSFMEGALTCGGVTKRKGSRRELQKKRELPKGRK